MDQEKLDKHAESRYVTEEWLVNANLTEEEYNYITNPPPKAQRRRKKKVTPPEEAFVYLSATQSKKVISFNEIFGVE